MGKHCEAVELLLARMDSNPEEFTENGRWEKLIAKWKLVLSVPDRMALESKLNTLWLEVFHKDVMNELLAETREDAEAKGHTFIYNGPIPANTVRGVSTVPTITTGVAYSNQRIGNNSNATNINLSNQSIKDIAAQLQQYASNAWKK